MSEVRIKAELRTEFGKGGARRIRRTGFVPAVLYGHGEAPRHISLPAREFAAILRHGGLMQVLNIDIADGTTALALPKAIQRDPVRDSYEHIDLLIVRAGEKITVDIPVVLTGEAAKGTMVNQEHLTIAVVADPTRLPEHVEASVDGLDVGAHVTAHNVKLPADVELAGDPALIIAVVAVSPTTLVEPTEAELEAAAEAGAEAQAEAPAAEAAPETPAQ